MESRGALDGTERVEAMSCWVVGCARELPEGASRDLALSPNTRPRAGIQVVAPNFVEGRGSVSWSGLAADQVDAPLRGRQDGPRVRARAGHDTCCSPWRHGCDTATGRGAELLDGSAR